MHCGLQNAFYANPPRASRRAYGDRMRAAFPSRDATRMFEDHTKQSLDTADQKYAAGDYQGAVQYYEDAIDGTPATADVHYKLALMFDDKLQNPVAAMYHFQRYLDLKPNGPHAKEATGYMKEDEVKLSNTLSHGALMSQEDAARLKNDNLALRKQLDELRASGARSAARDAGAQPPPRRWLSAPARGGGRSLRGADRRHPRLHRAKIL